MEQTVSDGVVGEEKAHTKVWVPTHPEMQRGHSYSSLVPLVTAGHPYP